MKPRCGRQRNHALTLLEVLVVIIVIAVLAAMLLPTSAAGKKGQKIVCTNNLKQISLADQIWAGEHGDRHPIEVSVTNGGTMEIFSHGSRFQNLVFLDYLVTSNEMDIARFLHCPSDTNGFTATNFLAGFGNQNISYFVGLDTDDHSPQTLISGDDNFEVGGVPVKSGLQEIPANIPISWTTARHNRTGNILLSDGSVQGTTSSSLRSYWQQTGLATNRLAIP